MAEKRSFRDSVASFDSISKSINSGNYAPIYLLMGDEDYHIDRLSAMLENNILDEAQKSFNQIIVYGKDSDSGNIMDLARQMPMMGGKQVIIVKEAQQLSKFENLATYAAKPLDSTVLVLCYKTKGVDKRLTVYKNIKKNGVVFDSVAPRDYEFEGWLGKFINSKGCAIEPKAQAMLMEHVGLNIPKISGEIDKLLTYLPEGTKNITAEHIENNIGISKDFNIFELTRALSERNSARAMFIADHFGRNPKDYPFARTIPALFNHFQRIFIVGYCRWAASKKQNPQPMPSDMELMRKLKLTSTYFVNEYKKASTLYPNSKIFAIIGLIREYDLKSKGIGGGSSSDGELLQELLLKIFVM
ncbi:MAG: DNA polymerase III subunit delta [Rikenellaceae bacterium]